MSGSYEAVGAAAFTGWIGGGHPAWLVVRGNSMLPRLPAGSRVLVAPTDSRDIRPGDLIVHRDEESLVCHRVLTRSPGDPVAFEVKGDAWGVPATRVPADSVVGRVVAIERNGALLSPASRHATLIALAIGRLGAACIVLRRRWRRSRHRPA